MNAVVMLLSPRVSAALLAAILLAINTFRESIMVESPDAITLSLYALSIFLYFMSLMNVNGILYCWSRKNVFLMTFVEALLRLIGYSLASNVVSLTIVLSLVPPFSLRMILLWM